MGSHCEIGLVRGPEAHSDCFPGLSRTTHPSFFGAWPHSNTPFRFETKSQFPTFVAAGTYFPLTVRQLHLNMLQSYLQLWRPQIVAAWKRPNSNATATRLAAIPRSHAGLFRRRSSYTPTAIIGV